MSSSPPTGEFQATRRRGVVAVVVREDRFLVIERGANVEAPGALCFPGGGIEADESPVEALVRELNEELSLAIEPLEQLWHSVTDWNVELFWWQARINLAAKIVPNPAEVAATHWLTREEMQADARLLSSNHAFLKAWKNGEFSILPR